MDKDLISRSWLLKILNEAVEFLEHSRDSEDDFLKHILYTVPIRDASAVIDLVKNAPFVDAVEVVAQRMIPVTERQPEKPGEYLVWKCQKLPHFAIDTYTEFGWYGGQYVMSWMPLPPKPEERHA